jgi:P-type conjugative transfer protein TrbG
MKGIIAKTAALAVLTLLLASCMSTQDVKDGSNWMKIQTIDVSTNPYGVDSEIPLTAVIQPEDLVTSPIIDITTLRILESETTSVVSSSLKNQEKTKSDIEQALSEGLAVNTKLKDDDNVVSSGLLAKQATESAFQYINSSTAFTESMAVYDYVPNRIYEIITSPTGITDLRMQPGEEIAANAIANGADSWTFQTAYSVENGQTVQHLFIRPLKVGLDTSFILLTNLRTYYFRIASFETYYFTALKFRYPTETADGVYVAEGFDKVIEEYKASSEYTIDLSNANYSYNIKATSGKPTWTPQLVVSSGVSTYIQFPVTVVNSDDLPSLYLVKNNEETLVNYRYVSGNLLKVDCVLTGNQYFILKSSQKEQVKITAK